MCHVNMIVRVDLASRREVVDHSVHVHGYNQCYVKFSTQLMCLDGCVEHCPTIACPGILLQPNRRLIARTSFVPPLDGHQIFRVEDSAND